VQSSGLDRTLPRNVLIYAGIDEAGYGPLLGPLCVACVAVAIEGVDAAAPDLRAPDLWRLLKAAVCDSPSDSKGRIAIADSKRLKGAKDGKAHPLRHLERGVLAALMGSGHRPANDTELYAALGIEIDWASESPWYAEPVPLPLAIDQDVLAISANRLRVACEQVGIRFAHLRCDALDGARFNQRVERVQKSDVNFEMAMGHVNALWTAHEGTHPRVVVDRHGGRVHYREPLQIAFPEARITIIAETDCVSRYRLEDRRGLLTISFEVESESRHLPNALASMTAKLTRELFMERMNRFFAGHVSELKPTAGYVEDGRRYLKDIAPALRSLGVETHQLVRSR
jgi:hypothetical protein